MINEKLLSIKDVSELLNVKESWIRCQVFYKNIPHLKIGGLLRFKKSELDKWIESNREISKK